MNIEPNVFRFLIDYHQVLTSARTSYFPNRKEQERTTALVNVVSGLTSYEYNPQIFQISVAGICRQ